MSYWMPATLINIETFDLGDAELTAYENSWYVMSSYAGNNAIRREHPEGKI